MSKQSKIDKISFLVLDKSYEDKYEGRIPFSSTQICINDKNLIFILRQYESVKFPSDRDYRDTPYDPVWHPAGNYEGIDPNFLYRQFLKEGSLCSCEVSPFQCGKHLNADWTIRFNMQVAKDIVIWDSFRLLTKSHGVIFEKKYDNFREFHFSRKQFEKSLKQLKDEILETQSKK